LIAVKIYPPKRLPASNGAANLTPSIPRKYQECLNAKPDSKHTTHNAKLDANLDFGGRREELETPAAAHHLRDDDEDEAGGDDGGLDAEGYGCAGSSDPLGLEIGYTETT